MKKYFASIVQWWKGVKSDYATKRKERRVKERVRDSETHLQLQEFDGEVFIAHNGVPIINAKHLKENVVTVLLECRETWQKYYAYVES